VEGGNGIIYAQRGSLEKGNVDVGVLSKRSIEVQPLGAPSDIR
jgi:hypothetical protein